MRFKYYDCVPLVKFYYSKTFNFVVYRYTYTFFIAVSYHKWENSISKKSYENDIG